MKRIDLNLSSSFTDFKFLLNNFYLIFTNHSIFINALACYLHFLQFIFIIWSLTLTALKVLRVSYKIINKNELLPC